MNGQVSLHLIIPKKGWPCYAETKGTQFVDSFPVSWLLASISITAGHELGRELEYSFMITWKYVCQHRCFGITPLIHGKMAFSLLSFIFLSFFFSFFSSFFFFLINSLELPGAVGCCRADRSHFRPVSVLKGARGDECVLGARSHLSSAMWPWRHRGVLSRNGTLPSCSPRLPPPVLVVDAKIA